MKLRNLFLIFIFFSVHTFSQVSVEKKQLNNKVRLSYAYLNMPVDKVSYQLHPTMSFAGLHYNIPINSWLYTGGNFHFGLTGDQGGIFTLGVNIGINTRIYKNLYFDSYIHFGGGGGYRSLVSGGAIINPNIGLQYKKNGYSFGIQYSKYNFFKGLINDDAVSVFIEILTTLRYLKYSSISNEIKAGDLDDEEFTSQPAVKNVQQIRFDYFFPFGNSRKDATENYALIDETLYLLGFEYQKYLTEKTYIYVHTDAIYKGLTAGFMDLFIGVGHNFVSTKHINLFAKAGIGAAGGRIAPEGGLTAYPSIGMDYKFSDNFALSAHAGMHKALDGDFEAYTLGFGIKYLGLSGGFVDPFSEKKYNKIKTQGIRVAIFNQSYFNMAKFGIPFSDIQMIATKLYYDINHRFYLSGEASFAYLGKSGGYAHGLFSPGIISNTFLNDKISLFAEFGVGVAGGGRVDTGEGIIVKPIAGINFHANDDLWLSISGGKIISPFGNVNSTTFNIGLSYGFSIMNTKK